jgi:hypothetical protein
VPVCVYFMIGAYGTLKSYYVTNWRTTEVIAVPYKGKYEKFIFEIGLLLHIRGNGRLYALKPGAKLEERVRISNTGELEEIMQYIDNEESPQAMQVLFLYPEDESPHNTPAKTVKSNSEKSESASTDRSTYQKRFAREITIRDQNKCRLCDLNHSLRASHIIDASAKLTKVQLEALGIRTKYEVWNGILLCANCHDQYDRWMIGIDPDGYLCRREHNQWIIDQAINIYPSPNLKNNRLYPDPILLEWKFHKFIAKRDNFLVRISNMFSSPTK